MHEDKFAEEKQLMLLFRDALKDFPKGKLIKSEAPDFILREAHKKKTGIELTRLHGKNSEKHNPLEAGSKESRMVNEVKSISRAGFKKHLHVKFIFNESGFEESDISLYASFLGLYLNKLLEKQSLKNSWVLKAGDKLPAFLDTIAIAYHPDFRESSWSPAKNFLLYELNREIIEHSLLLKEEKLAHYRSRDFDQYWLVLSTLHFKSSKNFHKANKLDKWKFSSSFNRIFLYELLNNKVYELNHSSGT
ncbi:MAG: hypothetical protein U5Q03_05155 [Bacteroidota bacterium]|nr:hypothetical protein [Bacteroidota bacterium]